MNLLDLPLELVQQIVFETIAAQFLCGSDLCKRHKSRLIWSEEDIISLSAVNKLFEREVIALSKREKFLMVSGSTIRMPWKWGKGASSYVARYVAQRPYSPRPAPNAHFPALINAVVDRIVELEEPRSDNQEHRDRYISRLCHRASKIAIDKQRVGAITKRPFSEHVFVGAIHLRKTALVNAMLDSKEISIGECESEFWGPPLNAAIQTDNLELTRALIEAGARVDRTIVGSHQRALTLALYSKKATDMVAILCSPPSHLIRHGVDYESSIQHAVELGRLDVAELLLSRLNEEHLSRYSMPLGWALRDTLKEACKQGMERLVVRLLECGGQVNDGWTWSGRPCSNLALAACAHGQERILKILIARGAGIGGEIYEHDLMFAATKGGHLGIIRLLLEAGVTLNSVQALKMLHIASSEAQAAKIAWYLLDLRILDLNDLDGAITVTGTPLAMLITAAVQHGNIEFVKALVQYGVSIDDVEFYSKRDCPPPIVTAMVFRNNSMVDALKELGAIEANPLHSIVGRHFRSGVFPLSSQSITQLLAHK